MIQGQNLPWSMSEPVSASVLPGFDREVIRLKIEHVIRAVLENLDTAPARVEVTVVDRIERAGTGAKEKLVAKKS
jgi:hypothetical protein